MALPPRRRPKAPRTDVAEFQIKLTVTDEVGQLDWADSTDAASLEQAVSAVADDALLGHGLRRLEVSLPAADVMARRAVQRAGFRLEGVRRQAVRVEGDEFSDVVLYGRLASDVVYGEGSHSGVMNSVLPRKRCIGHVVFHDEQGRILYCQTTFKRDWELPGGIVEPHESPREGAEREIVEELGVELPIGRLLVADWMPRHLGWDDALELIFDGGVLTPEQIGSFRLDQREIAAVHWVSVEEAAEHLIPLAARRLALIESLDEGETLYTEAGRRV